MKRTIATLGVLGLAAFTVAAPAMAAGNKIIICHAEGSGIYKAVSISVNALEGHDVHMEDIVPPNDGMGARNWTNEGKILYIAQCAPLPPGETPPVYPPVVEPPVVVVPPVVVDPPPVVVPPIVVEPPVTVEQPVVVEQPVANQPVVESPVAAPVVPSAVVPPAAAPKAAAPKATAQRQAPAAGTPAAPATTSRGTNQGYNAQTAVGGTETSPSWLAGLGALMAAGAAVAVRRRSRTVPLGG
jgi:LPXTG-motif cell wall-anchored protein